MKWDVSIGGQPFLFATSQQSPYRRETAEFRRQRVDQEREVGEQSLDSGYWLRSQSSFHLGEGLESAEPLSVSESEARFRFHDSLGVDVWTPGQLSLLHDVEIVDATPATSGTGCALGHGAGVLWFRNSTVGLYQHGVGSSAITNNLGLLRSITSTGTQAVAASQTEVSVFDPESDPVDATFTGGTSITFARWLKQRLLVADWNTLTEVTDLAPVSPPAALPTPFYVHPDSTWFWSDAAEGPNAIYVSGDSGDTSAIYAISVVENNGALELGTPTTVAEMPRGEIVFSMYSYLGAYLIVGTSKGARVASIQSDGSLVLGPLLVEVDADQFPNGGGSPFGVMDAVAVGQYVWVTLGGKQASTYRIDLGTSMEGDLRFPVASDLDITWSDQPGNGHQVDSITVHDGVIYLLVEGKGLVRETPYEFVDTGWLETGRIRMGTLQNKSWHEVTLTRVPDVNFPDSMDIRVYTAAQAHGPWSLAASLGPSDEVSEQVGSGPVLAPTLGPDIHLRIELQSNLSGPILRVHSPVFTGYQVSAIPTPRRSRLVSVPVACWDFESDRDGQVAGHDGYAWSRLSELEAMESDAGVVPFTDFTTGENVEAYVERVSFTRLTPPFRGDSNAGGVATVLLRILS